MELILQREERTVQKQLAVLYRDATCSTVLAAPEGAVRSVLYGSNLQQAPGRSVLLADHSQAELLLDGMLTSAAQGDSTHCSNDAATQGGNDAAPRDH